jgi:hypothetical protein
MNAKHLLWGLSGAALSALMIPLGNSQTEAYRTDFALTAEHLEILNHMKVVYLDDGLGNKLKTVRIIGVNVQIVNGLEATNGSPLYPDSIDPVVTKTNGLGNLIVGYNEQSAMELNNRTGSHNIVVGMQHGFLSYGGIVAAKGNTIAGPYGTITGGIHNDVLGPYAAIAGGELNRALEDASSIAGGRANRTRGWWSVVSGGVDNDAMGEGSTISGGASCVSVGQNDWNAGKCFWCEE